MLHFSPIVFPAIAPYYAPIVLIKDIAGLWDCFLLP